MEYPLEELDNRIYPICDKWYLRRKLMLRSRGQCKGVKRKYHLGLLQKKVKGRKESRDGLEMYWEGQKGGGEGRNLGFILQDL